MIVEHVLYVRHSSRSFILINLFSDLRTFGGRYYYYPHIEIENTRYGDSGRLNDFLRLFNSVPYPGPEAKRSSLQLILHFTLDMCSLIQ